MTVSFPIASEVEEEDWVVEVALSFICSVAGPQEGPTDPIQAKSFNFQLHYSYSDMIGQTHKYIPRFSMGPRKCAFLEVDSNIYWGFQMTAIGFGFELLGNGKCIRNCTSNWIYPVSGPTTSSWPPGVGFCANGQ